MFEKRQALLYTPCVSQTQRPKILGFIHVRFSISVGDSGFGLAAAWDFARCFEVFFFARSRLRTDSSTTTAKITKDYLDFLHKMKNSG